MRVAEYKHMIGLFQKHTLKCIVNVATNPGDRLKIGGSTTTSHGSWLETVSTTLAHLKCGHVTEHTRTKTSQNMYFQHGHTLFRWSPAQQADTNRSPHYHVTCQCGDQCTCCDHDKKDVFVVVFVRGWSLDHTWGGLVWWEMSAGMAHVMWQCGDRFILNCDLSWTLIVFLFFAVFVRGWSHLRWASVVGKIWGHGPLDRTVWRKVIFNDDPTIACAVC